MHGQLLINKGATHTLTLDLFVANLDEILGPMKWDERQSSNYVDERYFISSAFAVQVTAATADDSEFNEYDFWLSIESNMVGPRERSFLDGLVTVVARALASNGYKVLLPNDMSRPGNGGTVFRINPDSPARPRLDRIITEAL